MNENTDEPKNEADVMSDWSDYRGVNSLPVGEYLWRAPHVRLESVWMQFRADVWMRGHGGRGRVSSPYFDHWDGYRLHVPKGLQYRHVGTTDPDVTVEGIDLLTCPFCGQPPTWKTSDGFIGSCPHQNRRFEVAHCIAKVAADHPQYAAEKWNARA